MLRIFLNLKRFFTNNEYDNPKKWESISDITLRNYSNMQNRLSYRNKFSNYILIYYSIFLIVNTLTAKYINNIDNFSYNRELSEYFGIILSIIILVYSLVNNNANYPIRINNIIKSINSLKTIKREIKPMTIKKFKDNYFQITDNTELRTDIDFYETIKGLCREENTNIFKIKCENENKFKKFPKEKINNYISELGGLIKISIKIFLLKILDIIILLIPIIATILCFIIKWFIYSKK